MIEIDCLGQRCPLPVIALARLLKNAEVGTEVRVLADDPAAANDIPAWCRLKGQEFLGETAENAFEVRKISDGPLPQSPREVTPRE
ncbi:sulfurtransferase TusA family protein [Actinoplanes sp. NPDC049265]|uniref:sulfurtransferase TusA family protein n=1 Tax=Actinoplanes sp. NPDC049265 TaxID=3363902 RepID=UPI0037155402